MATREKSSASTAATPLPDRHALVIALDRVGPDFYIGWSGKCASARNDRDKMVKLLCDAKFNVTVLEAPAATRDGVQKALDTLIATVKENEYAIIYFTGHGTRVPDVNLDEFPDNDHDDVWCLYDGMFADDEIARSLYRFAKNSRVVAISETCYSGTIITRRLEQEFSEEATRTGTFPIRSADTKLADGGIGDAVFENQQEFYRPIFCKPSVDLGTAEAAILQLSAATDKSLAFDTPELEPVGQFTQALVDVWNGGKFSGKYIDLFNEITKRLAQALNPQEPAKLVKGTLKVDMLRDDPFAGG